MKTYLDYRDECLEMALEYSHTMTGTKQDRAIFDYLCGCVRGLYISGVYDTEVPPWLWVIGVRGGDRVAEVKRMLAERDKVETSVAAHPALGLSPTDIPAEKPAEDSVEPQKSSVSKK